MLRVLLVLLQLGAAASARVFSCTLLKTGTRHNATCIALGELYASTNGSTWNIQRGWAFAANKQQKDYCKEFHGVTCDDEGHVVKLELSGNNLTGQLSMAGFSSLTRLANLCVDTPSKVVTTLCAAFAGAWTTTVFSAQCQQSCRFYLVFTHCALLFLATNASLTFSRPGTCQPIIWLSPFLHCLARQMKLLFTSEYKCHFRQPHLPSPVQSKFFSHVYFRYLVWFGWWPAVQSSVLVSLKCLIRAQKKERRVFFFSWRFPAWFVW